MPRYEYLMQAEAGYRQITGEPARSWMRSAHPDQPHLKVLASGRAIAPRHCWGQTAKRSLQNWVATPMRSQVSANLA